MSEDITDIHNKFSSIKKQFNEYQIELITNINSSLTIGIKNDFYYYETNFNENYLQQLFNANINNIYNIINELIDNNDIKIEKNKNNLKLILNYNDSNIELNIEISFKYIFETLNELNNKRKKKDILIVIIIMMILIIIFNILLFSLFINNDKKGINKIENNNLKILNNKIKELNEKINEIENAKLIELNEIKKEILNNITLQNNKIDRLEKNNITEINNELEENKNKFYSFLTQYIYTNITYIDSVNVSNSVFSISIFPSGNIIASSYSSLIIYDNDFNIINVIINSQSNSSLNYVDIYDENNFVTCDDNNIKTWIKNQDKYSINKKINNAHNGTINKVIYNLKGNLISCSDDGIIKIWELKNEEYVNIKTFNHNDYVSSIFLLEDKNILISTGDKIKFWYLNNEVSSFKTFDNINVKNNYGIERIDYDKIIICDDDNLIILSISKLEIIKKININYSCYLIKSIKNKGLLLVEGYDKTKYNENIYVYRSDNYELIQTIENADDVDINGFAEINNRKIVTFNSNGYIKIWSF